VGLIRLIPHPGIKFGAMLPLSRNAVSSAYFKRLSNAAPGTPSIINKASARDEKNPGARPLPMSKAPGSDLFAHALGVLDCGHSGSSSGTAVTRRLPQVDEVTGCQ
jgi:hypothetical protein